MSDPVAAEPTTITFEIWVEDLTTGEKTRRPGTDSNSPTFATNTANDWNSEEADNARMEMRRINRRFYVVAATTTRVAYTG